MVEARGDCGEQFAQGGEETVVRSHAAGQFPDSLDGCQLWTVRRQKQQGEHGAIFPKQGFEKDSVVVLGIVQHNHHALAARAMPQKLLQKGLERGRVERGAHGADELASTQADGTEAGD